MSATEALETGAAIERISALVAPLGVTSETARNLRAAARAIAKFQREMGERGDIVVPGELIRLAPSIMTAFEDAGITFRVPNDLDDVRDAPLGISLADAVIVETGSAVLDERQLGERGIGMLSLTLIVLIPVSRIIPSLAEAAVIAAASARRGGYVTFMTGPSRTADIEMSLTVGVQGPGRVHYLFVESLR